MCEKIKITVFTDPMMGLSYESEPVREKLEKTFEGKIEFDYVMALLVRDVSDFMLPKEIALGIVVAPQTISSFLPVRWLVFLYQPYIR